MRFVKDNRILWLQVPKEGTPPVWAPGVNYKLGDTVVPTNPPDDLKDFMFQCVGFVGKSGTTQPTWPQAVGTEVIDGNIVWITRDPLTSPPKLGKDEFYLIDQKVTVG